jgi:phosphoesterase RecJ-like protein
MKQICRQIYNKIQSSKNILIISHKNPDGDALGSSLAFYHWTKKIGIKSSFYCDTEINQKYDYLPHIHEIKNNEEIFTKENFDAIVILDSSDLKHTGLDRKIKAIKNVDIIDIDHHITNEHFGNVNLVLEGESSTSAILYRFFTSIEANIDAKLATLLLTGIITDTDNFTNAASSLASMYISWKLVQNGADIKTINNNVVKDKTITGLKLWGKIFSRLVHHEELDLIYTYVTQDDIKEHGASDSDIEGMANFMNNIKDGKAGFILKELPDGKIKASIRTTKDNVDVSKYAQHFGGGGHKKAAGFTIDGPINYALKLILGEILEMEKQTVKIDRI